MRIHRITLLAAAISLISISSARASYDSKYLIGVGYFSQNALYHTTSLDSGKTAALGSTSLYPLIFTYSTTLFSDWNFSPQFQWTVMPRSTTTHTSSMMLLEAQFGKSFANTWQWYVGPGLMINTLKGKGGTTVLSNGTGTATFAIPGNSVETKTFIMDLGVAWDVASQRLAFGSVTEDLLSTTGKRAYHLYLNWSYAFSL